MKTQLSSLEPGVLLRPNAGRIRRSTRPIRRTSKADPQIELLTPDDAVTSAAAKAVSWPAANSRRAAVRPAAAPPAGLKAERLLIVGLGKQAKVRARRCARRPAPPSASPSRAAFAELALASSHSNRSFPPCNTARAAVEGAIVGDFDPDTYRTDRKDRSVRVVHAADARRRSGIRGTMPVSTKASSSAKSQNFARTLVNEPGNKLTPTESLVSEPPQMAKANRPEVRGLTPPTSCTN